MSVTMVSTFHTSHDSDMAAKAVSPTIAISSFWALVFLRHGGTLHSASVCATTMFKGDCVMLSLASSTRISPGPVAGLVHGSTASDLAAIATGKSCLLRRQLEEESFVSQVLRNVVSRHCSDCHSPSSVATANFAAQQGKNFETHRCACRSSCRRCPRP